MNPADPTPVILVDDDVVIRHTVPVYLKAGNFACLSFGSAEEALDQVSDFKPYLVVSDYHLPGMNGLEMIKRLKLNDSTLPCILITGFKNTELIQSAWMSGVFDFLAKPLKPEVLLETLNLARVFGREPLDRSGFFKAKNRDLIDEPVRQHALAYDLPAIKNLWDIMGAQGFQEVVTGFRSQVSEDLKLLSQATATKSFAQVAEATHRMAGAAATLGLGELETLARKLEAQAKAEDDNCFGVDSIKSATKAGLYFLAGFVADAQSDN